MKRAVGRAKEDDPKAPRPGLAQTGHESRTQESERKTATAAPGGDEVADDACVVSLAAFEGPLDLLLHLIQKHELDILDIPIGFVTQKFLEYLSLMQELAIDVASEYLVMAATLAHIKSKTLLPDAPSDGTEDGEDAEEEDPRAELVRRLLEYQKYKAAAEDLGRRDLLGAGVFARGAGEEQPEGPAPFAPFGVFNLLDAFSKILARTNTRIEHEVVFDRISITERMIELTDLLKSRGSVSFDEIFSREGRESPTKLELVVTFLAVLEMCRLRMMRIYQTEALAPLHVDLVVVDADADAETERRVEPDGDEITPQESKESEPTPTTTEAVTMDEKAS